MKKPLYILLLLFTVVASAQQPWYKYSPMDYAWKNVGNEGFSPAAAESICIAFSPSGRPFIAYMDSIHSYKATVMEFDGINWMVVGNSGFSSGTAYFTSLAFSPSGQPYVAYQDSSVSYKATVMYFDAPAGIKELQPSQISIYPNPATDKITIETSGETKESYLESVFNLRMLINTEV